MPNKSKRQLEAILGAQKRKAALLLVEKDLADHEEEKKFSDIAEECGTTRNTLYKWRTRDKDFQLYMNLLADDFFLAHQTLVYKQHMKLIKATQPSTKAIELWYRKHGMLTDKKIVEEVDSRSDSIEDIEKETAELEAQLNEEEAE